MGYYLCHKKGFYAIIIIGGDNMATIATHNGSSVSKKHNERDVSVCSKEPHIDLTKPHENWINEEHRSAYERIFGEATIRYNNKQKRSDRKITSYYDKIVTDKKKHAVYEMIIGVYDDKTPIDVKRQILKEFVDSWKERNPNLELVGAYYHADEKGKDPHVHIDYIPVAYDCKRGLETQNALNKALEQQGFHTKAKTVTAQILWERRENDYLESLCRARGIDVEHNLEKREHLDTDLYKRAAEISHRAELELSEKIDSLSKDYVGDIEEVHEPEVIRIPLRGAYISKGDYDDLRVKYENLVSRFKKFANTLSRLAVARFQERDNLKALVNTLKRSRTIRNVIKLRDENTSLHERVDKLEVDNSSLLKSLNNYKMAYRKLNKQFAELHDEYEAVITSKEAEEETVPISQYKTLSEVSDNNFQRAYRLAYYVKEHYDLSESEINSIMNGEPVQEQVAEHDDFDLEI